ncbi:MULTISPECIES: hypothetical protein [unclassified Moraxella]|uniref:hypothetical protein n=1 Tax=unclassified Moraxella TaxID=2685852 RepID=UPI003AF8410A
MIANEKSENTMPKSMIFAIDILCFLVIFPLASGLVYQDASILAIMFLFFMIAVPLALVVGWLVIYLTWIALDSKIIPHSKYNWLDGLLFGVMISAFIGFIISGLSIKFSLSMAITGGCAGLLLSLFVEPKIAVNKEQSNVNHDVL